MAFPRGTTQSCEPKSTIFDFVPAGQSEGGADANIGSVWTEKYSRRTEQRGSVFTSQQQNDFFFKKRLRNGRLDIDLKIHQQDFCSFNMKQPQKEEVSRSPVYSGLHTHTHTPLRLQEQCRHCCMCSALAGSSYF